MYSFFFFNIYTFFNISHSFHIFIYSLPSTLISLFNFPFIFIYFVSSYSYPLIINFSLSFLLYISMHNFPSQKKVISLSQFFVGFFFFSLHLFFRLLIICIFKNSTLSWCNLVLCFKFFFLSFLFSLIVKCYPIAL